MDRGGAADGGLVDLDDLVQVLQAQDLPVGAGVGVGAVQLQGQLFIQNLVDEGGFPRTGDPGDADEFPQGNLHVDVPQVVLGGALYLQEFAVAGAAVLRHLHLPLAAEVLAGEGLFALLDAFHRPGVDDLPAVDAGPGAHVYDIVGGPHGVLVVLHHDDGVAQVPQALEGVQQLVVVPLVQADGGLVQNIQHAHEGGADLGGQADALALPAGEGAGGAGQSQVLQAHALQETKPGLDLLEDGGGDHLLPVGEGQSVHELQGLGDGLVAELADVQAPPPSPPGSPGRGAGRGRHRRGRRSYSSRSPP